jgi:hypothetical protein
VPRISTDARARIFQRFELEAGLTEPDGRTKSEQPLTIGRDEVRHLAPFPDMAVQPQTAIHRVNHPGTAGSKLSIFRTCQGLARWVRAAQFSTTTTVSIPFQSARDYLQAGTPSIVAGAGVGETAP